MQIFYFCIISVFAVIGFIGMVKELVFGKLHPKEITLFTYNNENDIEYILRSIRSSFPNAQIKITDCGSTDATVKIAQRLGIDLSSTV